MTPRYCSFFSIYPQVHDKRLESEFSGTDVLVIREISPPSNVFSITARTSPDPAPVNESNANIFLCPHSLAFKVQASH